MKPTALPLVPLLASAVALAGCASPGGPAPAENAPDAGGDAAGGSTEAVAWSFTDTQGVTRSNATAAGDPTVIFWMATWCGTCKSKTDDLSNVHAEFADAGVDFFSVSWDPSEGDDDLEGWKSQYDQPWPHGVDAGSRMARLFGVTSQSSVVVLDAEGNVVKHYGYGRVSEGALRADLAALTA